METSLFLQCLFILIIACVSPTGQSPSISRNSSSEPEYLREWNAYNKGLKNDSHPEKNHEENKTQKSVVEKIKKPISVVIVEPIFPNIHKKFVRKLPSSPDATVILIYDEEVIFVPEKILKDTSPENYDVVMQVAKDGVQKSPENANLGGAKSSVVPKSPNKIAKNNGTHPALNKTEVIGNGTLKNVGHESPLKNGHPPIEEDNPYIHKRKENSNSTLSGNSTQKNGATGGLNNTNKYAPEVERIPGVKRWYPVHTDELSPAKNPSGGKPGFVLKSVNTTGTHAPLNKTGIVDNKSAKNDSKEHKQFLGSDHGPIDKNSSYLRKSNQTSNSAQKPAATVGSTNQPHNNHEKKSSRVVNSSNPVSGSKPLQSADSTALKPSAIAKSPGTSTVTNAPLDRTIIVDGRASKSLGDYSKEPKDAFKGYELPAMSGHPPFEADSPYMYKRDATSIPKPGGYFPQKTIGLDSRSDDIYELRSGGNVPAIPELKDPYEGGSHSHIVPIYFAN